jgi:hypothetical protein
MFGFQMAVGCITSTVVILQFWKFVFPIVDMKDPADNCEFAIEAVQPANDVCKLTNDAVVAVFGRVEQRWRAVSRCFTTAYGRASGFPGLPP